MSPLSLNPPAGPSMQGQNQLFNIPPNNQDSSTSSLSCRTLFNILDRRQAIEVGELRVKDQQDDKQVFHDGSPSSNNNEVRNSSFNISPQPVMEQPSRSCDHNLPLYKVGEQEDSKNGHGCAKWMPSKMRLMKKMMMRPSSSPANNEDKSLINTTPSPRFQNQGHSQRSPRNNSTGTTRVCSDCNTSTTPLWRSGPNGPKSLCNACGIRQRKARRAMAEAANGLATSMDNATSTKTRVHNKEKKSRTGHFTQLKNKCKSTTTTTATTTATASSSYHHQGQKKKLEYFKNDFAISLRNNNSAFQQVFPRDEVAEAALLLMDLSCGFVHF